MLCTCLFLYLPILTNEWNVHYTRIPWIELKYEWQGYLLSMIGMSYIALFGCSYISGHRLLKLISPLIGAGIILLLGKFIYGNILSCKTIFCSGKSYQAISSSAEFFIILLAGPIMGFFTWSILDLFPENKCKIENLQSAS
jgi:hypothetical protein